MNNRQEGKAPKKASGPEGSMQNASVALILQITYSLIPKVTYVYYFYWGKKKKKKNNEKTHHQKESEISHRMEDETPSVSYHSNLTLQHPSGLSHLH